MSEVDVTIRNTRIRAALLAATAAMSTHTPPMNVSGGVATYVAMRILEAFGVPSKPFVGFLEPVGSVFAVPHVWLVSGDPSPVITDLALTRPSRSVVVLGQAVIVAPGSYVDAYVESTTREIAPMCLPTAVLNVVAADLTAFITGSPLAWLAPACEAVIQKAVDTGFALETFASEGVPQRG